MSATTPPPLPPDQWAFPTDEKGEPKKKYVLWVVLGAAGCLVACVVAGFLLTIFVPNMIRAYSRAQHTKAQVEVDSLCAEVEAYAKAHGGQYPDSLEALRHPVLPIDPWDRPYRYDPPNAERSRPDIYSLGADGLPGGSGVNEDLHPLRLPEPEKR